MAKKPPYVPGLLLKQLGLLRNTAADLAHTVETVRAGDPGPEEPSAAFGNYTPQVALAAAPLLDKYAKSLCADVPFGGDDLRSDEAALRVANDIKAVAELASQRAGELVAFFRGRLSRRTRNVVACFEHQLANPYLKAPLRAELEADCRPMLRHLEARSSELAAARSRSASHRAELEEVRDLNARLEEEVAQLRHGAAPPRPVAPAGRTRRARR